MSKNHTLFLILGSVLIGLILAELGLRVVGISYPIFSQFDGDLGVSLRPQAEGWFKREGEAFIRINSAGLRDREHALPKPDHVLRIAVLGDSYAEALQIPMEDTFWAVAEREIKSCVAMGHREPELINFGVSGYGTAQELIMLRHRVWTYSPDIVLLVITPSNDIRNNSRALEKDDRRPYFVLNNRQLVEDTSFRNGIGFRLRSSSLGRAVTEVRDSLRVFQLTIEALRRMTQPNRATYAQSPLVDQQVDGTGRYGQQGLEPPRLQGEAGLDLETYKAPRDAAWEEAWQVTEDLIKLMHAEVKSRDTGFMVITVSSSHQVGPDQVARRVLERRLGVADLFYSEDRIRALGENRFEVLALAPLFQTYAEEHRSFLHGFPNSGLGLGHWNIAGHHLAGQLIAQKLCRHLEVLQPA
ncbi:MAG TPA: SGNH/GDSL hydrolase family protein [Nitrospira sp.]|nr:SGNH/GDSL hydrolase family protein [Nitrospira sp.]